MASVIMKASATMKLKINGEPQEAPEGISVAGLLEHLGLAGKPVVVERNQMALFPREHVEVVLSEGDLLEIVQITAGG